MLFCSSKKILFARSSSSPNYRPKQGDNGIGSIRLSVCVCLCACVSVLLQLNRLNLALIFCMVVDLDFG